MSTKQQDLPKAPAFPLNELLGYRMARLSASIGTLAEREAQATAGLTLPEYRLLAVLSSYGPHGVSGLQKRLRLDKAWISRSLAKLLAKKLVSTRDHESDARRRVYSVTAMGEQIAGELIQKALARQARLMSGFSEDDITALFTLLNRLQQNADAQIDPG